MQQWEWAVRSLDFSMGTCYNRSNIGYLRHTAWFRRSCVAHKLWFGKRKPSESRICVRNCGDETLGGQFRLKSLTCTLFMRELLCSDVEKVLRNERADHMLHVYCVESM